MGKFKVAVVGACGGVGQPLSMLLKKNFNLISQLNLLDIVNPKGIALDLSHIPNKCQVNGFFVPEEIEAGLTGVNLVVMCLESSKILDHSRGSLFAGNCKPVESLMNSIAQYCPLAMVVFITNPVNSLVPLAVEALAKNGIDGSKRVVGVTTLDYLRTLKFVSESLGIDESEVTSIVVGGHSTNTITPLITDGAFSETEMEELCKKIIVAGFDVFVARDNVSATLSIAEAGLRIVSSILCALDGMENIVQCAYVKSDLTRVPYFGSQVLFGTEGVKKLLPLPELTEQQQKMVDNSISHLEKEIKIGLDYFNN